MGLSYVLEFLSLSLRMALAPVATEVLNDPPLARAESIFLILPWHLALAPLRVQDKHSKK